MTNPIHDIRDTDVIFIIGSNTTENHPVISYQVQQAINKGAKLIVADPRQIPLAAKADIYLQLKPGTNTALLNGMMHVIINEGLLDEEFIQSRCEGYEELKATVARYSPGVVADICGVPEQLIIEAARTYGRADNASILYAMGITQHISGTSNVLSIANLAMLCGQVGKPKAGVNPLRGQNNVQGSCDMGALPGDLPGYQKIVQAGVIEKFERAWGVTLPRHPGLTVSQMMEAAHQGELKALYVLGENPMVSDPDTNHIEHALKSLDFLVVQDIFLTETAQLAHVVLPATSFAEKDGTFTSTDRRIQRVRKAVKAPGQAKPDWLILTEIMNKMGYPKIYHHPSEIMDEIASVTPQFAGVSYDRLENISGLVWPVPDKDHPGTPILHVGSFMRGKGKFVACEHVPSAEQVDKDYPFILTTGRVLYHYHTRTMTGRVAALNHMAPASFIEINSQDAAQLGIKDGDTVQVSSRRGTITTTAMVTDKILRGTTFMTFHYAEGNANVLTTTATDPVANEPELKVCAVKITKYS